MTDVDVPLFDVPGGELKQRGQVIALQAVPVWADRARLGIAMLAATGREFTSEDLTALIGLPRPGATGSNRNNAVGAVFSGAARRKEIRRVGYRNATVASSHAAALAVWVGTGS